MTLALAPTGACVPADSDRVAGLVTQELVQRHLPSLKALAESRGVQLALVDLRLLPLPAASQSEHCC